MSDDKKKKSLLSSLSELSFVKKLKNIKHIEIIIVVIFVLILLLICFSGNNTFSFLTKQSTSETTQTIATNSINASKYATDLENKLKTILSSVNGAGNVEVMVSVDGFVETNYATEQTTTTSAGVTEKKTSLILVEKSGIKQPIVISEKMPTVTSVVVVSSGAKDTKVKLQLMNAVQTILNIDCNKILILEGK